MPIEIFTTKERKGAPTMLGSPIDDQTISERFWLAHTIPDAGGQVTIEFGDDFKMVVQADSTPPAGEQTIYLNPQIAGQEATAEMHIPPGGHKELLLLDGTTEDTLFPNAITGHRGTIVFLRT